MPKQQRTIGAIIQIPLKNGHYAYAQILDGGSAFFNYFTKDNNLVNVKELLDIEALFIIRVYL